MERDHRREHGGAIRGAQRVAAALARGDAVAMLAVALRRELAALDPGARPSLFNTLH